MARLLPQKLSAELLGTLKSAIIDFACAIIAGTLIMGIATALGTMIGALIGSLAGGVGAAPGAALGAKIGFEIGLFLLKWIGLGLFVTYGASFLGRSGKAFGEYINAVWQANSDRRKLEESAGLCAEAIKEFLLGVLVMVVMLVAAWAAGRAMGALAKTKFGRKIGIDRLLEWVNRRTGYETLKSRNPAYLAKQWQ